MLYLWLTLSCCIAPIEKRDPEYSKNIVLNHTSLDDSRYIRYTAVRRGVAQLVAHRVWDAGVVGSNPITPTTVCGSSAMVAHLPSKQMVAGSSPVSRSIASILGIVTTVAIPFCRIFPTCMFESPVGLA